MLALLIDDDFAMRGLLEAQLSTMNDVQTITARNGQEGLTALQAEMPDIIFSDLNMPVMDGLTLWKTLRAEAKTEALPFVLITSVPTKGTESVRRDPRAWVLPKSSVNRQQLVEIIEAVRPKA